MNLNPFALAVDAVSLKFKLMALAACAALLTGAFAWFVHHEREVGRDEIRAEREIERAELRAAVQAQRDRNMELQRAAEIKYTVVAEVRDRFITKTITEVRNATTSLAVCTVSPAAVRMLNDASHCTGEDRAAACGAGEPLRSTR
jgi:hypothetical protein